MIGCRAADEPCSGFVWQCDWQRGVRGHNIRREDGDVLRPE